MTDNEIIKALECCAACHGSECSDCPCQSMGANCEGVSLEALDLINRQKAEIESDSAKIEIAAECIARQDKEIENLRHNNRQLVYENLKMIKAIKHLKAEAIKEFAERLKKELNNIARVNIDDYDYFCIGLGFIDNLIKEMEGEGG